MWGFTNSNLWEMDKSKLLTQDRCVRDFKAGHNRFMDGASPKINIRTTEL